MACLTGAVHEAERLTGLDDLRADRGLMDIVDAEEYLIGQVPAPIAVGTDNGPCFRGVIYAEAFRGEDSYGTWRFAMGGRCLR